MLLQHDTYRHLLDAAAFLGMSGDPETELDLSIRVNDVVQCALNADPAWQQARVDLAKAEAFLNSDQEPELVIEAWDLDRWNEARMLFIILFLSSFTIHALISLLPFEIPFAFLISLLLSALVVNALRERTQRNPYTILELIAHATSRIRMLRRSQLHRNRTRHWMRIRSEASSSIQSLSRHYASLSDQLTAEIRLAWKKGAAVTSVLFDSI